MADLLPRTHYTTSDGVALAYQILSEDGPTYMQIPGAISNLALEDTYPAQAGYYERLTKRARVIRFDKRGTGLSDRGTSVTTLDQQVADIEAIFRATDTERAIVSGISHGGSLAVLFTVTYPERVEKLILVDAICCDSLDPFTPMSDQNSFTAHVTEGMGGDFETFIQAFARRSFPDLDSRGIFQVARYLQATASPAMYRSIFHGMRGMDLRPMLRRIEVPTLVIHARDELCVPAAHGRYFAEHIAHAQYLEPVSNWHVPWFDAAVADEVLTAMETFVAGGAVRTSDPVVVSVLFTDIVDSTTQQKTHGDAAWQALRKRFESTTQGTVERNGGRVVSFTGDGVMAAFPAPGQALRTGKALVEEARALGIEIRAGLHAGEAYEMGEDLSGTCVNIAARVSAVAGANEILTTEVVRGMVEGGGFAFDDAGEHDLKGIGPRRLVKLV